MKTASLLTTLILVGALPQHAIAADLPIGVAGECAAGLCGTPNDNDGGGFGGSLVSNGGAGFVATPAQPPTRPPHKSRLPRPHVVNQ